MQRRTSSPNGYSTGDGDGGFDGLGNNGSTPLAFPGNDFSQSISVYINTSTPAPALPGVAAYWIDMSPDSVTSDGVGCYPYACADEHNFRLFYNGTSVGVTADGGTSHIETDHEIRLVHIPNDVCDGRDPYQSGADRNKHFQLFGRLGRHGVGLRKL